MPDNGLPDGWQSMKLADLAEVVGGSTPPRANTAYFGGGIPWATPTDITNLRGRYLSATQNSITEAGRAAAGLQVIPIGSVLLTSRASIGLVATNLVPVTTNQGFQSLIPHSDVDGPWLYHLISFSRPLLERLSAGSTFREVSRQSVRSLRLSVPPTGEQRRIAEVLDAIDAAIEKTEAVLAATERLRSVLLGELLTRGVPGWHTEWTVFPRIGRMPTCWELVRLGELLKSSVYGPRFPATLYSDDGNVATLRTTDLDDHGTISLGTMPRAQLPIDDFRQFILADHDLVITRSGTCGIAAIFHGYSIPVLPGAFLIRLRPEDTEYSAYLKLWLNSDGGRSATKRLEAGGVQKNLNAQNLCHLSIPWPPASERAAITAAAHGIAERVEREELLLADMYQAKASLGNALLSGRLRVTTDHGVVK